MSNPFEEAMHQGYSAADMVADMNEMQERMNHLGCEGCKYGILYHPTCNGIIQGSMAKCPYRKEKT